MKFIKLSKSLFIMFILLATFTADSLDFRVTKIILFTDLGQYEFYVEVAETNEQLAEGLAQREEIPDNSGMLFLFPKTMPASMWMKDVGFNLDMVFLNRGGIVTDIKYNASAHSQNIIQSQDAVRAVLEINAGIANRIGLKIGDKILNESFN